MTRSIVRLVDQPPRKAADRKKASFRAKTRPADMEQPRPSYVKRLAGGDSAMYRLRMEMYGYDINHMAEAIGCSTAALYAVRSGRTKWPRAKTLFGIIDYCGLKLVLVKE